MPAESQSLLSAESQEKALAAFLATHVTPYDVETDDYERPPFAADIKEGKSDAVYTLHQYHTKVPPRVIIPLLLHYSKPGDVILDPFCGSGMTGVAARMCSAPPEDLLQLYPISPSSIGPRHAILNDLSPAACHIARNYTTPVDPVQLETHFDLLLNATKADFDWLYRTEHYEPAVGLYSLSHPEVASRLQNAPNSSRRGLLNATDASWELLSRTEVEERLGYPVSRLPRKSTWEAVDVTTVDQWICIPATLQYTVWSDVYRCEGRVTLLEPTGKISTRGANAGKPAMTKRRVSRGCSKEIVLWDVAVDSATGEVAETFRCPHCGEQWRKTSIPRVRLAAVVANFSHEALRRDKTGLHATKSRYERPISAVEQKRISDIAARECPYALPSQPIDPNGPQYKRNALRARSIKTARDFYTHRNLWAIGALWHHVNNLPMPDVIRERLRFGVTSICYAMTRMYVYRASRKGGVMNASLYFPSLTQEMNVSTALIGKKKPLLDAARWGSSLDGECTVTKGTAAALPLPDKSVDYVFADPPFGSNIYYSEASIVWEAWLGSFTDRAKEAVVHRKNDGGFKRIEDYKESIAGAFREMFRVLKPGRWATIEFNNSDGGVFEAVKSGIQEAGFQISNMLLLDKTQKTFKQSKGLAGEEDVVDKDVVFNLFKPSGHHVPRTPEDYDIEQQVVEAVRGHLTSLPARIQAEPAKYNDEHRTTATINSMLMNALIPRGVSVEQLNLPFIERVCSRYFRKIGQHWYLRGEAVGGNGSGGLFEEEVAVKDSLSAIDWLRQKLRASPMLIGELKPLWMRATGLLSAQVTQDLVLEELLTENFWRDQESNRWREPTEEERERMNDDRSIRVLHDAERYIADTLRRATTDAERCDWIDVLFKACRQVEEGDVQSTPTLRDFDTAEGYRLITRLFQSVLRDHVSPDEYSKASKQSSVASNRVAEGVRKDEAELAAQRKKKERTLFD